MIVLKKINPFRKLRVKPGQVILFLPAMILLSAGILILRNHFYQPVIRREEFPSKNHGLVIFLKYPLAYPFLGDIEAIIDVYQFPDHHSICIKKIGSHRWASEASDSYGEMEWDRWDRILIRSRDRSLVRSVHLEKYRNLDPEFNNPW